MLRSMFSGVSGLRNHQERLDVVGNNISNVNTTGFKRGRVTFKDIISQTVQSPTAPQEDRGGSNPQQVGLGMTVGSIDNIHTQGSLETTGRTTDLAIEGDGFFVLDGIHGEAFTRAGNFDVDAQGRLVDIDSGNFVQGYQAEDGVIQHDAGSVGNISIPLDPVSPMATTGIEYSGNLDSEIEAVIEEALAQFDIEATLSDVNSAGHLGAMDRIIDMANLDADIDDEDEEQQTATFVANEIDLAQVGDPDEDGIEASYALEKNGDIIAVSEDGIEYQILEEAVSSIDDLDEETTFAFDFEGEVSTIDFAFPVISGEVDASLILERGDAVTGDDIGIGGDGGEGEFDNTALVQNTSYAYKSIDEIDIPYVENVNNELEEVVHALTDEDGRYVAVSADGQEYHALTEAVEDIEDAQIHGEDINTNGDVVLEFDEDLLEGWIHLGEASDDDSNIVDAAHYVIQGEDVNFDATATVEFDDDATPLASGDYNVQGVETTEINGEEYEMALFNEEGEAVAWSLETDPVESGETGSVEGFFNGEDFSILDAINEDVKYEVVEFDESGETLNIPNNGEIDLEDVDHALQNQDGEIVALITEDELAVLNDAVDLEAEEPWEGVEIAEHDAEDEDALFEELGGLDSGYVSFEEENNNLTATHYNKVADGNWIDEEGNALFNSGNIEENEEINIDTEYADESIETTTIEIFDQQGQQRTLTISFTKRAQNDWEGHIEELGQYFDIEFDDNGNLISDSEITIDGSILRDNLDDFKFDVEDEVILDLERITQTAGSTDLHAESDGQMQGNLETFEIDEAGVVTGTYDNGETQNLAQLQMATFTNPEGLAKAGDNLFRETSTSGGPNKGTSGTGRRGDISPGTLEMSNVDMAQEFTDMIITQRGFQANSRTISTSDEILEELTNLVL